MIDTVKSRTSTVRITRADDVISSVKRNVHYVDCLRCKICIVNAEIRIKPRDLVSYRFLGHEALGKHRGLNLAALFILSGEDWGFLSSIDQQCQADTFHAA